MNGAFVAMAGKRKSGGGGGAAAAKQKILRRDSSASLGDLPPYFEQMMTWFFGILPNKHRFRFDVGNKSSSVGS